MLDESVGERPGDELASLVSSRLREENRLVMKKPVGLLRTLFAAFALLLAAFGTSVLEGPAGTVNGFPKIDDGYVDTSVDQFAELTENKDFILVDVHIPCEGEIPQTDRLIPFDEIGSHLDQLPAREAPIVLYCPSGSMRTTAAKVPAGRGTGT